MMKRKMLAVKCTLAVSALCMLMSGVAMAQAGKHNVIREGYRLLREAHGALNHAGRNYGGHRRVAVKEIDEAIGQLNQAMKTVKAGPMENAGRLSAEAGRLAPVPKSSYGKHHKSPGAHKQIHRAIQLCQQAKAVLEKGGHDFGGHRVAAIRHIDKAIDQLHKAIQYAG